MIYILKFIAAWLLPPGLFILLAALLTCLLFKRRAGRIRYLALALTAILTLCAIEPFSLKEITFEVCSAVGTVGLTLGVTPQLGAVSRLILILLMYAGRLGGLTFVLLFSERRSEPPIERPAGKILIG